MSIEYRPLLPEEETRFFDIVGHSLTIDQTSWRETFRDRIGAENLRAVLQKGQLVGGLGIYRMGQWFGGRSIPCAGVFIVGVAPEARGTGVARQTLVSMLEELRDEGTPLACLYPSTQRLYRSVGFEQAGSFCRYRLPLASINVTDRELPVIQVDEANIEALTQVAAERGRRTNGNLDRSAGLWQRITRHPEKETWCGVIGTPDNPQGYICYRNEQDGDDELVHITDMAALTRAAARRLWTFIADHRSIQKLAAWTGPPTEPLLGITEDCKWLPTRMLRWMLRAVDVKALFEARGYSAGVSGELHLEVTDDLLPANNGRFTLHVAEGRGEVATGGRGDLRTDVRGLVPLLSSFLPPTQLQSLGWIEGSDAALASAAQVFAGPQPWMPEIF